MAAILFVATFVPPHFIFLATIRRSKKTKSRMENGNANSVVEIPRWCDGKKMNDFGGGKSWEMSIAVHTANCPLI